MFQDPMYIKIIERLGEKQNRDLFEECVVDLIRRNGFPGAVPIRGGSDAGMDGAVADGKDEPFPIIVTTSPKVIDNLTRSLDRYVEEQGMRRKCIIVTNQSLSPKRQRNLRDRAREKGFLLVQRVEQAGLALLLYREPKWCKELLGITGDPSALSVIPVTSRPLEICPLVAREDARNWLRNSMGDRLLVGEPGAGKTSLLHELAMDEPHRALFVVSEDEGRIADAIREQDPKSLIVDDAHVDISFLKKLRQLRSDIQGEFEILASCWTGDRAEIEQLLGIPSKSVHNLKRMTRDEIAQVIIESGVSDNNWLIDEIVRQADGLPGLAGTLAYFALQGRWKEIYTGEALITNIQIFYKTRLNEDVQGLLACFALGGKYGMPMDEVAEILGISILNLRKDLSNLAHGGVIAEMPDVDDYIKVRPKALRHGLIRDVFFSNAAGKVSLPESYRQKLLDKAPSLTDTTSELIGAKARGGDVPKNILESRLLQLMASASHWQHQLPQSAPFWSSNSELNVVREFAWLGPDESKWVAENLGLNLSLVARPLLDHVPQLIIPSLLADAVGDNRPLHSNTEHPLRLLQDWIKSAHPGTSQTVNRRAKILRVTKAWLDNGNDRDVGFNAMLLAINPRFELVEHVPGSGDTVRFYSGLVSDDDLRVLQEFWKEVSESLEIHGLPDQNDGFIESIAEWAYPDHCTSDETCEILRESSEVMALDLARMASGRPGTLQRLRALMRMSYAHLKIDSNVVVDTLYPDRDFENGADYEQDFEQKKQAIEKLAQDWKGRIAAKVAEELESLEMDMQSGRGRNHRFTPYLCQVLAEASQSPLDWFDVFVKTSLQADTVIPFLKTGIIRGLPGWENALTTCFETERLASSAIEISLTLEQVPSEFKLRALQNAPRFVGTIETLVFLDRVSQPIAIDLLCHTDSQLAGKVAVALWQVRPKGDIVQELRQAWENALVNYSDEDFWLADIFTTEPGLGKRWLLRRFEDETFKPFMSEKSIAAVVAQLDRIGRGEFLRLVPERYGWDATISLLVADSVELFGELPNSCLEEYEKLSPLGRPNIDKTWFEFAKLALSHKHSIEDIVYRAFGRSVSWTGRYSNVLKSRYEQFEAYRNDDDETVRQIAECGYKIYFNQYIEQKKEEDDEDVFGRD